MNKDNNLSETSKGYVFYTILAGILTLIPVSSLILGVIDSINPISGLNENIYIFSFYILKVIGLFIYFFVLKKANKTKITLGVIAGIFLFINGLMYNNMNNMPNKGIDYIGEVLAMTIIFQLCLYTYFLLAFILFIIYAKKFIFRKKVIKWSYGYSDYTYETVNRIDSYILDNYAKNLKEKN